MGELVVQHESDDIQRYCTKHEPRDVQEGLGECRVQTVKGWKTVDMFPFPQTVGRVSPQIRDK